MSAGMIEARSIGEAVDPSSPVAASEVGLAGFRFPPEVIMVTVLGTCAMACRTATWEELLVERGVEVDYVRKRTN
jgi:hypothetical protein